MITLLPLFIRMTSSNDSPHRTYGLCGRCFRAWPKQSPLFDNRLACVPLELRLRGKPTRHSPGTPIFYTDIPVLTTLGLEDALLKLSN
ncbi:hypothetical protein PS834_04926 [Pseudomonas fluorescens]|nr:hypothetical protein PS834_04926 [Pseudomonas fluorescens]